MIGLARLADTAAHRVPTPYAKPDGTPESAPGVSRPRGGTDEAHGRVLAPFVPRDLRAGAETILVIVEQAILPLMFGQAPPPSDAFVTQDAPTDEVWLTTDGSQHLNGVAQNLPAHEPAPVAVVVLEGPARSNAEAAATALEALALRVRSGEVWVPAFRSELAEEAVLAGVLASILGWRR